MSTSETVLVQKSTTGALHGEAVLIQKSTTGLSRLCWYMSTIGTLGILYWYSGTLYEHTRSCVGTVEYYRNTGESVLVQQSTIGTIGKLCWYRRVL